MCATIFAILFKAHYARSIMAAWPSGKAEDCKSFTPSSNLGAALVFKTRAVSHFAVFLGPVACWDFGEFDRLSPA
jgi:hypothetical protein